MWYTLDNSTATLLGHEGRGADRRHPQPGPVSGRHLSASAMIPGQREMPGRKWLFKLKDH